MSKTCHVQPEADAWPAERYSLGGHPALALVFATLLGAAASCLAQDAARVADPRVTDPHLPEVLVQAERQADEEVTRQVQQTLAKDPWIYTQHVTVTTHNGVVRVEGIAQDTGEWFRIIDLARRTKGARRVDTSGLALINNDPDGG